jgi:23S rRNA (cytosine1962-C5)-methyltransferase
VDILNQLPTPANKRIALHVRRSIESTIHQGHPWLFDKAISKQSHEGQAGDLAVIYDSKNRFLAVGLYDPQSPIRVKILQANQPVNIDQAWFEQKLSEAIAKRALLHHSNTNGYRLVHGENDGLPALIIDRYADTLVVKLYSEAWIPHLHTLLPALDNTFPSQRWVLRLARNVKSHLQDGQILKGDPLNAPIIFEENGLLFSADVIKGHKTGFFFDQRDNRQRVGELVKGKTVLDVFAYVGAFALYCAKGGAESITCVDISQPALQVAQETLAMNQQAGKIGQVKLNTIVLDAFKTLEDFAYKKQTFDVVIIDPPSFAKSESEVQGALTAYAQLTDLGQALVAKNGVIILASCSSRVSADTFYKTVTGTLARAQQHYQELARTQHAIDHPIGFPEGAYLKAWYGLKK